MNIEDRIWGSFDIDEKILIELLDCREMKRLENISQFGLPYKYYPLKGFSRYEHSIGVMLLLRKLDAGIEEQVAGLLHDVSHAAFSHLVDWIIGDRQKENYQDLRHHEIINNGEISKILMEKGFDPERIADHSQYSLLEQPPSNLCADRVDYSMREFLDWASPDIVESCKSSLINFKGKIAFNSKSNALEFGYGYMRLQREHWGGAEWMFRWQIFSDVLRYALDSKIIFKEDFDKDDPFVLSKLENSSNLKIKRDLEKLRGEKVYEIGGGGLAYKLHKKFRYIDPIYLEDGKINRLSEIDNEYMNFLQREREHNEKGIRIHLA